MDEDTTDISTRTGTYKIDADSIDCHWTLQTESYQAVYNRGEGEGTEIDNHGTVTKDGNNVLLNGRPFTNVENTSEV